MSTLVLRSVVNRALTSTEIDANFTALNTDKVETTAPVFSGTVTLPSQSIDLTDSNLPDVAPSLNLDFANSKQLDSRITFGRGSGGAYYDGKTTAKAEENLLLQSNFASGWSSTDITVTGGQTAPDSTTTAISIIGSTASSRKQYYQVIYSTKVSSVHTISVYVKANGYTNFLIGDLYYGSAACTFDLTAANYVLTTGISAAITPAGNGWYRCSVVFNAASSSGFNANFVGYPSGATANVFGATYAGDGTSGIYLWGAQLEQRSSATAYTPTTTSPITNYIPVLLQAPLNTPRFDHDSRPTFNGTCTVSGSAVTLPTTFADGSSPSTINKFYTGSITISGTAYVITNYVGSTRVVTVTGSPTAGAFSLVNKNYGQSLGLLIEEARENKLFYSGAIGGGNWSIQASVNTLNTEIAPDGTLTASSSVPTAISAQQRHYSQSLGVTSAISYTYSVYAKKGGYSGVYIRDGYSGYNNVFDLNSGTVAISIGSVGTITSVGNGWYRCTSTMIPSGVNAQINIGVTPNGSISATTLYTGDGYSGIYIWGAQLETGSFATSYIPTPSNATVTRQPDIASMTGTNFSSWYNQSEGTICGEYDYSTAINGMGKVATFCPTAVGSYATIAANGGGQTGWYSSGLNIGLGVASITNKQIISYQGKNFSGSINGASIATSSSSDYVGTSNSLYIGQRDSGQHINGHIRKLTYYPKALSAPQLQGLTK